MTEEQSSMGGYTPPHNTSELSKKEKREFRRQERKDEQRRAQKKGGYKRMFMWAGVAAVIVLVVYGIVIGVMKNGSNSATPSSVDAVSQTDWVKGERTARVTIIEYADFQCPACKAYYPVVKSLSKEFSGSDVAFVLRHFPLRSIHANAESSSRAAEAAGLQGKFWGMHDLLFERQGDWEKLRDPKDTFKAYAQEIGIDVARFESDMDSDAVKDAVNAGFASGISAGVNSTPSFFINGNYISNPANIDEFRTHITNALNASS
ncbi:MAG: thioredoxin domain-containing protein [bacterium]|nr:thioredoxin domain-containing protein [bacterium]